jgi:hypothetical protein
MSVWGIYCHLERHEPVVVAVAAEGSYDDPTGSEVFRHRTTEQEDWPTKLMSLRGALGTKLGHARPTSIVIRSMDWPPVRPRETVIRPRLLVEGMLLELCRNHTTSVVALHGKAIAGLTGIPKDALEARARELFGRDLGEAGAAALAALYRQRR